MGSRTAFGDGVVGQEGGSVGDAEPGAPLGAGPLVAA
jgi:hypothetical protein